MLVNLLDNAAKYSPPEAAIDLGVRRVGQELQFWVADRGPGIAEGERQRVFEPFYRRRAGGVSDAGGAGLGLSIARGIAEAQGGSITYSARDDGGGGACSLFRSRRSISTYRANRSGPNLHGIFMRRVLYLEGLHGAACPTPYRRLKRLLFGRPLASDRLEHERLNKKTALAVLSSDAISSVAYATDQILLVLAVLGTAALSATSYRSRRSSSRCSCSSRFPIGRRSSRIRAAAARTRSRRTTSGRCPASSPRRRCSPTTSSPSRCRSRAASRRSRRRIPALPHTVLLCVVVDRRADGWSTCAACASRESRSASRRTCSS